MCPKALSTIILSYYMQIGQKISPKSIETTVDLSVQRGIIKVAVKANSDKCMLL